MRKSHPPDEDRIRDNAETRIRQIRASLNTAYEDRINGIIDIRKYQEIEKRYEDEQKSLE